MVLGSTTSPITARFAILKMSVALCLPRLMTLFFYSTGALCGEQESRADLTPFPIYEGVVWKWGRKANKLTTKQRPPLRNFYLWLGSDFFWKFKILFGWMFSRKNYGANIVFWQKRLKKRCIVLPKFVSLKKAMLKEKTSMPLWGEAEPADTSSLFLSERQVTAH